MHTASCLHRRASLVVLSSLFLLPCSLFAQGPLTPPGAPAPTMKTLDQVEPRIAINTANTPGDATSLFKITQPGSYYLTGNITGVSGKHGILITANDVTLDLMGFALTGVGGSLEGVTVPNISSLTIRNGTARGWGQTGIGAGNAKGSILENLQAVGNGSNGILAGENSAVRDCTARLNTGIGISAQSGSTIVRCTAAGNTTTGIAGSGFAVTISQCAASSNGGVGIRANWNCTISDCASRENGSHGIELGNYCVLRGSTSDANTGTASGISAGDGCMIDTCTVSNNANYGIIAGSGCTISNCASTSNMSTGIYTTSSSTVSNCSVYSNGGNGIETISYSTVSNCAVSFNGSAGILTGPGNLVLGNNCQSNGTLGAYAGIRTSSGCRIEGNTSSGHNRGINVLFAGSVIIRNTCSGNTTDWAISANNVIGPIIDRRAPASAAVNGFTAPDSTGSTHPNANFSY